jgi:hypothetical protein
MGFTAYQAIAARCQPFAAKLKFEKILLRSKNFSALMLFIHLLP